MTLKHFGTFRIHWDDLNVMPEVIRRMMHGMIVTRAQASYAWQGIEYDADGPQFAESDANCTPPAYCFTVENFRFKWTAATPGMWQDSVWSCFRGQTPLWIEQEPDGHVVRAGLDAVTIVRGIKAEDAERFCLTMRRELGTAQMNQLHSEAFEVAATIALREMDRHHE